MHEIELFGRTFRSPVRLPAGYLLAPLTAVGVIASTFGPSAATRRAVERIVADGPAELARIEAELDRSDPNWRLDRILADREPLPDDRNSARRVEAVLKALPDGWGRPRPDGVKTAEARALDAVMDQPIGAPLGPEAVREVEAALAPLGPALEEARPLADMGEGRHDIRFADNPLETRIDLTERTPGVAKLLQLDAALRASRGHLDSAIDSARAILGAARSIGDEPALISILQRDALDGAAVDAFVKALNVGEPSPEALARIQADLLAQAEIPKLRLALRGERAILRDLIGKLADGRLDLDDASDADGNNAPEAYFRHNQARLLRTLTDAVEVAGRPSAEWGPFVDRLEADRRSPTDRAERVANAFHDQMLASLGPTIDAELRVRASLRAAALLAAAERWRQAKRDWPPSASALVPEFLDAVPADPFTGDPLRLARTDRGVVAYAVGKDGRDDGGKLNPRNVSTLPGTDVGHLALDPKLRGREPESEAGPAADPEA